MPTNGELLQHGEPHRWGAKPQPDAREGQAGPPGVADGLVVPRKPGNSGGGKGSEFKAIVAEEKGRESGASLLTSRFKRSRSEGDDLPKRRPFATDCLNYRKLHGIIRAPCVVNGLTFGCKTTMVAVSSRVARDRTAVICRIELVQGRWEAWFSSSSANVPAGEAPEAAGFSRPWTLHVPEIRAIPAPISGKFGENSFRLVRTGPMARFSYCGDCSVIPYRVLQGGNSHLILTILSK
jgi:hypothetical protein